MDPVFLFFSFFFLFFCQKQAILKKTYITYTNKQLLQDKVQPQFPKEYVTGIYLKTLLLSLLLLLILLIIYF